jgi:hypothetical protein
MEKRVKILSGIACVAAFTLAMSTTSRAQNVLLADPGAEQELSAPNPNPLGQAGWAFFGGATFLTTPFAHGGTNVVETPGGAGGYSVPGAFQNFAATAGQTFVLAGWVYTPNLLVSNSNDFAILQLQFYTGAPPSNYGGGTAVGGAIGVNIGTPIGPGPTTVPLPQGVWTYASVTGTAVNVGLNHVNSVSAYGLGINADANATFYFDDLDLHVIPEPSSILLVLTGLCGLAMFARKHRA